LAKVKNKPRPSHKSKGPRSSLPLSKRATNVLIKLRPIKASAAGIKLPIRVLPKRPVINRALLDQASFKAQIAVRKRSRKLVVGDCLDELTEL